MPFGTTGVGRATGLHCSRGKGVFASEPFVAGTGWRIAYFDLEKSGLDLFQSQYHGDHIAEADPQK